ncbi:MAG: hypothetical protein JSW52_10635 [Candidatus Coatesbacteria bacterium]|nr:MAG: hypothetical protein JSW52_10635 [Candidatus Coatesbacteria bacterium]
MNAKKLLYLVFAATLALSIVGCGEKPAEEPTEEPVTEEPVTVELTVPDEAGAEVVMADVETAKIQTIEGLDFAATLIGWDNGLAATVIGKAITNLEAIKAESSEDDAKIIAGVAIVLTGVKERLEDPTPIPKSDIEALKDTVLDAVTDLQLLWYPAPSGGGAKVPEWKGDLMKEKWKEGGDALKEKYKEGGDALKHKWAEGHPDEG